jgi:hypothetical protein
LQDAFFGWFDFCVSWRHLLVRLKVALEPAGEGVLLAPEPLVFFAGELDLRLGMAASRLRDLGSQSGRGLRASVSAPSGP